MTSRAEAPNGQGTPCRGMYHQHTILTQSITHQGTRFQQFLERCDLTQHSTIYSKCWRGLKLQNKYDHSNNIIGCSVQIVRTTNVRCHKYATYLNPFGAQLFLSSPSTTCNHQPQIFSAGGYMQMSQPLLSSKGTNQFLNIAIFRHVTFYCTENTCSRNRSQKTYY